MINYTVEALLNETKRIIQYQNKIEILKGETFNIFSILKMERKETKTHTPLLAELLDPSGTHKKGNLFLKLFLETICIQSIEKIKDFKCDGAKVDSNKPIGIVVTTDGFESGGNLDIYIEDIDRRSITIENKIDENTEQPKQVVRYCNYNKNTNTVFYLTPSGTKPSEFSCAKLTCGIDYFVISYKTHIIDWLKKCIRETVEQPILRETIRQYIILLQKITFTMENEPENELNKLMLKNFEEATYINSNFIALKSEICENIRNEVSNELKEKFRNNFNIILGNNTSNFNSQIWIKYKKYDNAKLYFGIESFSYDKNQKMNVGIFSVNAEPTLYATDERKSENNYWPYYSLLANLEGYEINFNKGNTLEKLYNDKEFKARFVAHIITEIQLFINIHNDGLAAFLDNLNNGQNKPE